MLRWLAALALPLAALQAHAVVNGRLATAADPMARSVVMVACIEERPGSRRVTGSASGVIVGPSLVLTAAHIFSMCKQGPGAAGDVHHRWELRFGLAGTAATAAVVRIGPDDFRNEDPSRLMSALDVDHDTFRDYAFVHVPGGIPPGMRPARIQADTTALRKGATAHLAGYGFTHRHGTDYRLRKARLVVSATDAASPSLPPVDPHLNTWDRQHYLEFRGRAGHPCLGDSGAPLYVLDARGEPVVVAMLTHLQTVRARHAFCRVPVIGMRMEAVAAELLRLNERAADAAAR